MLRGGPPCVFRGTTDTEGFPEAHLALDASGMTIGDDSGLVWSDGAGPMTDDSEVDLDTDDDPALDAE